MKKRIALCAVLFAFAVFSATAEYYPGLGDASAFYVGTMKDTTLEKAHHAGMRNIANSGERSAPIPLNGKLSKRQSKLLWKALEQYDYAAGEIYRVTFIEKDAPKHLFALTVQIDADGSCTWMGFTCDSRY